MKRNSIRQTVGSLPCRARQRQDTMQDMVEKDCVRPALRPGADSITLLQAALYGFFRQASGLETVLLSNL